MWAPLENNPTTLARFVEDLGVHGVEVEEIWSLDPSDIPFFRQDPFAIIYLYRISTAKEEKGKKTQGSIDGLGAKCFFTKQKAENACGTIALIHSLMNNLDKIVVDKGSWFDAFIGNADGDGMEPEKIGCLLRDDETLQKKHKTASVDGEVALKEEDMMTSNHFVSLTSLEGTLVELDGRRDGPVVFDGVPFSYETCLARAKEQIGDDEGSVMALFSSKFPEEE